MTSALAGRRRQDRLWLAALVTILVVANLATFGRAIDYALVWDDAHLITQNPAVTGEATLWDALSHDFFWLDGRPDNQHTLWRPVTVAYLRALYAWGEGSPAPFHAASLVLHLVCALLLFAVARRWFGVLGAFIAAALFSLHPLRVESVVWVSGAGDLLCGAFLLGALATGLHGIDRESRALAACSVALFGLAALSKETAFVFPLFALVFCPGDWRQRVRRVWPYFAVAAVVFAVRSTVVASGFPSGVSVGSQALTFVLLVPRYVLAMLWPGEQVLHSAMTAVRSPLEGRFLLAAAGFAAIVVASIAMRRHRATAPLVAGVGWTVGFLLPVCVIGFSHTLYSERYTYIPAMGFSALVVGVGWSVRARLGLGAARRWLKPAALVALVVLVMTMAVTSRSRGEVWRSNEVLYGAMVEQNPSDALALFNLGIAYVERGELDRARPLFEAAVRHDPSDSQSLASLGNFAQLDGDLPGAVKYYERALAANADNVEAYFNLAIALEGLGRCREAMAALDEFVQRARSDREAQRATAAARIEQLRGMVRLGRCR